MGVGVEGWKAGALDWVDTAWAASSEAEGVEACCSELADSAGSGLNLRRRFREVGVTGESVGAEDVAAAFAFGPTLRAIESILMRSIPVDVSSRHGP